MLNPSNRRKFRSQTSDNMDRWKAEQGRGREKRKIRRGKSQKKEDADARKGRKVAKHCVFPMIWGPGGSKSRLAKAAGAEPAGQMRDEKLHTVVARSTFRSENAQKHTMVGPLLEVAMSKECTPLWREAHFEVKMYKTPQRRTTFGSWDVEKVHAVVARSTFPSQKCTKHTSSGPLLAVEMLKKCTPLWREAHFEVKLLKNTRGSDHFWSFGCRKKCTPLWREAHFEVKMHKTHHGRTTFGSCDVERVHAVVARSTFWNQNVQNTPGPDHFWKLRCRKSARRCGAKHISKSKCTKHTSSGPLLAVEMLKKCTPLWREAHFEVKLLKTPGVRTTFGASDVEKVHAVVARRTFRGNMLNTLGVRTTFGGSDVASLQYTTLQDITLHYTPVHYIALHYTPVQSTTLNYTTPHYITLSDTATQIDR